MLLMDNIILSLYDLGKAFRAERKALGLTQADVAQRAGLRRETIIQIESGENVQAHSLIQATSALGKALSIVDRNIDFERLRKMFDES
jgi:transcriptional regulator with XRE-family HTH domain